MNDRELSKHDRDKLEIKAEQQEEKQLKKLGSMRVHAGHTIWELNLMDKSIQEAEIESVDVPFNAAAKKRFGTKGKVVVKEHCMYCSALNLKNANKKFAKMILKRIKK